MAQTSSPRPAGGANAPVAAPRAPMPNPLTQEDVSKIKGTNVYGTDEKKIGDIDTVLINPSSKTIDRMVVKAGGVLGVGGHDVAIPVDQFTWDTQKEGFKLSKTTDELKAMPEWKSASSHSTTSSGSSGVSGSTGAGTTTAPATAPASGTPK
jgi:sporulation protein YlmC with PRC-barrel domain